MEDLLLWGLVLLGLGAVLLIAELFLPSGGILSVVAGVCAIAGIIATVAVLTLMQIAVMMALATPLNNPGIISVVLPGIRLPVATDPMVICT